MKFKLDLNETFPHLARPPIIEAVIHWRARAQSLPAPDLLQQELTQRLPEYTLCEPLQQWEWSAEFLNQGNKPAIEQRSRGWIGFRLATEDGRHVVQFTRDGVTFSRIRNYEHWRLFSEAALRVWRTFLELAAPVETQRLGVRFINQWSPAASETLSDILKEPPACPSHLPLKEFLYQSTYNVPGNPFEIRVVKVMQPVAFEGEQSLGLFLDVDVYTTNAVSNDFSQLEATLAKMRWLKNKVFFSLITDQAVKQLEGDLA